MFITRKIAKTAVNVTVASAVATGVETAVSAHVENPEENEKIIFGGSLAAGIVVAHYTRRITDPMVDKIADWRLARKESKNEPVPAAA